MDVEHGSIVAFSMDRSRSVIPYPFPSSSIVVMCSVGFVVTLTNCSGE